jgi:anaphase-promoting complex subunit 2
MSYQLKDAATASSSLSLVGKTLRASVCRRLLHTGASTSQILDLYVSMIRALRVLDPSDLLLNYVAAPVRKYLMSRKDTVRCIVSSLTVRMQELSIYKNKHFAIDARSINSID